MTTSPTKQRVTGFRLFLLASCLIHGIIGLVVLWRSPLVTGRQQKLSGTIMVNLAPPATSKTSRDTAPPTPPKQASGTVTTTVAAVQTTAAAALATAKPTERPVETVPTHSTLSRGAADTVTQQHTGAPAPPRNLPELSRTADAGRAAPREIAFGSAIGPSFRKQTQPVYPSQARRRGKEGTVLLRLSISERGELTQVEVLDDPGHGFSEAAIEAVRNSSFTPAHHNGRPTAVRATLPIRFTLR